MRVWSGWLGKGPPRRVCQGVRENPVVITDVVTTMTIGQSAALVSKCTILTSVLSHILGLACR